MAIWIRNVDPQWFDLVASRLDLEEINLWAPAGRRILDGAETGDLVFLRVRGRRGMAGCGLFFNAAIYFADDAWDIFGPGNGAADRAAFWTQVREKHTAKGLELYPLGCHDLVGPTYFTDARRRLPEQALQRLGPGPIDEASPDGKLLLDYLREAGPAFQDAALKDELRRPEYETGRQVRVGRSGFRIAVHNAYRRTCAITGNTVLPTLEAVHFIADQFHGALVVTNATLLRRDLHPLLEQGYMTISADYRVVFSKWLPRAFPEWETYRAFNGKPLTLPEDRSLWPDPELLARHRTFPFFKGGVFEDA